jgi:acetyl esterase
MKTARESKMAEPYVRSDVRAFLDFLNNVPGPRIHELGAPAARAQMAAGRDLMDLPVGDLATIRDFAVPGAAGDIAVRLFDSKQSREPGPAIVFFHGGGFVIGDLDSHASLCAEIARVLDLPVLAVDYRLAPENPWPAAPDDCEAAARWLADSPEALGRRVTSLIVCGDSAGGTLAIVTAMALRDTPAAVPVIAQFAIYPAADLATEHPSYAQFAEGYLLTRAGMEWFNESYAADFDDVRGAPLRGDLAGMPPALVLTASLDPIRDQGRAYAAALIAAGVPTVYREASGNIHGFVNLRKAVPSSSGDLLAALAAFAPIVAEAEADRVMAQAAGTR